ncbi:nose resistant to fluoxetine protein 6 [Trichonephila clavata]|uniref:Nose resistant to fluoxetine protein 6 n=1 Tax=Trichonephila clavata TaxID=2740835 RepID=A0A8X6L869_TRICU|nr:nose resistant to fluoxetine protein 6 [Trichonephila clavata]
MDSVEELHGDFGLASMLPGFTVKMFNRSTRMLILRVRRRVHSVLATSLPMVTSVEKVKLAIKTLHLSGTMRCAYKFVVNYDKEKLCEIRQNHHFSAEDQVYVTSIIEKCQRRMEIRVGKLSVEFVIIVMDASSKVPEGILFGTFSTFGSYDECIAVKTPEKSSQIQYIGQYCSVNIQPMLPENERQFTIHNAFKQYPKLRRVLEEMNVDEETLAYYYILKHRIGLCIPSTCTYEDIQNVTDNLANHLMMKISIGHCETSEKASFTKGQIISMCGVFLAFAVVIMGTILDFFLRHRLDIDMDIEEIVRKNSSLRQFSYAFSAYRNACKILNTSIPSNHLSPLHGIKFLSMTWIMLGHVYYCKDYLTLAGLNRIRDLGSNLAFQVVLNTAFAADTFFFLSGLLVVYSTFQYLENSDGKFSIVGFYIKRYCRLTPSFLMISAVILLGPLAGSGPIWNETLEPFVTGCQNYWWTNLFYFSNFIPTAKTCVPHGWFLSCDMQFYFISPIIILGLYRRPKMGLLLIAIGIITSMASAGFLTFLYDLPPVSLFSLPDQKDINEYLDTMGYKPYAHFAAYCIGMATGFLLSAKQKIPISKCLQIFGWSFAVTSCTLVVYGTWNWNSGILPDWSVSVAYATCSRAVWALGIAWLIISCHAGYGGVINNILSWHGFIPLSRLSYLAYLIHPLLMYLYASYVRSPFYFSQYVLVYLYLGHLCVTFGLAFIFSLTFELPFLNLEKIISRRLDQNRRKRRASFTHYYPNWQHPEYPEIKDSVVLMRRRTDRINT